MYIFKLILFLVTDGLSIRDSPGKTAAGQTLAHREVRGILLEF
jgi:hypothetical protein